MTEGDKIGVSTPEGVVEVPWGTQNVTVGGKDYSLGYGPGGEVYTVPIGTPLPPGATATPQVVDPSYSLLTNPNYHPELSKDISNTVIPVYTPGGEIQMPLAQWLGLTIAEQQAIQSGNPLPAGSKFGLVELDVKDTTTGEPQRILQYDYLKLSPEDRAIIKAQGVEGFNQYKAVQFEQQLENTVLLDNGDRVDKTFFESLPTKIDDFTSEYSNPRQLLQTKGIDAFNAWAAKYGQDLAYNYAAGLGANLNLYTKLGKANPKAQEAYVSMLQGLRVQESGLNIVRTARFLSSNIQVGPEANDEWMKKADYEALPSSIRDTVSRIGISGYQDQMKRYEEILSPYFVGESPLRVPADENYYDLSRISYEDAQRPEIREAISTICPSFNLDQLGKTPLDKKLYNTLKNNPTGKISKAMLAKMGGSLDQYYPIEAIFPPDYQAKKQELLDSGLSIDEVNKSMSSFYMTTGSIDEYQEYAKKQGLDVTFQPSTWQKMTPWREEIGQTVTLQGGAVMAMNVLVPSFFVARNWNDLSNGERAFNIILDVLSIMPFVGAATLGARGVSTAGKAARITAIAEAVSREAVSQIKAPVTMLIHPIGTIKAGYRTVADVVSDIAHPRKLPESVITTANHTVKIRVGTDMSLPQAIKARDELMDIVASGERPIVEITDKAGNGVRVELAQSKLMQAVGGGVVHGTPFGEEWIQQIKNQGYAIVSESTEGKKLFFSAEPHSRFALANAMGEIGSSPTIMIFSKDNPVIKSLKNSGKLYNAPGIGLTVEIEKVAPVGTVLWRDIPNQVLYTRVGSTREVIEIWLDKPLSAAQIVRLKALNLVERLKAPFKAPIKIEKIGKGPGAKGLTEAELKALADIIEEGGNSRIAKNIRKLINEGDIFRTGAGLLRRNSVSLNRYDPVTGEVYRSGDITRVEGRIRTSSRLAPARTTPIRTTLERVSPVRTTPARTTTARITPKRTTPERTTPERTTVRRTPERTTERTTPERTTVRRTPERTTERTTPERTTVRRTPARITPERTSKAGKYPPRRDKASKLSKKDLEASVAWNQGKLRRHDKLVDQYIIIHPPYGPNDKIYTEKVPEGVPIVDGPRSAYDTLRKITKGNLPSEFGTDMGIMDVKITSTREIPKIKFLPDPTQVARHGHIHAMSRRALSPRIRISR